MVVLLEESPLSIEKCCRSVSVTIGFLVTTLIKALLLQSLSLAEWPTQGRMLMVPNYFHFMMMEPTVLIWTFNAAEIILYYSPD